LPPPGSNALAINRAHVVDRPADAHPKFRLDSKSNCTPLDFAIRDFCSAHRTATSSL
jgi:hypothetical protein